jgi:hypothetical protein
MELRDKSLEEIKQFNLTYNGPDFTMENILESVSEYTSWMHLFKLLPKLVAKGISIKDMIEKTHEVTNKSVDAQPIATPAEKLKSIENTLETIYQAFNDGIFESDIPTEDVLELIQEIRDILSIQMSNPTTFIEMYEVLGKGGFRHSPRFKKLNSPTYLVVNTEAAQQVFFID